MPPPGLRLGLAGSSTASCWSGALAGGTRGIASSAYDDVRSRRPRPQFQQPHPTAHVQACSWRSAKRVQPSIDRLRTAHVIPPLSRLRSTLATASASSPEVQALGADPPSNPSAPSSHHAFGSVRLSLLGDSALVSHITYHRLGPKGKRVRSFDGLVSAAPLLEELRGILRARGISDARFVAWHNAITASSFTDAKAEMDSVDAAEGIDARPWPAFVLLKTLPRVSTASDAANAMTVLRSTLPSLHTREATQALGMLFERIVLDLRLGHLFEPLVAALNTLCERGQSVTPGTQDCVWRAMRCLAAEGSDHARAAILELLQGLSSRRDAQVVAADAAATAPDDADWILALKSSLLRLKARGKQDGGELRRLTQPLGRAEPRYQQHRAPLPRPLLPTKRAPGLITFAFVKAVVDSEPRFRVGGPDPELAWHARVASMRAAEAEGRWDEALKWCEDARGIAAFDDTLGAFSVSDEAQDVVDQTALRNRHLDAYHAEILARSGRLGEAWQRLEGISLDLQTAGEKAAPDPQDTRRPWHTLLQATARDLEIPNDVWPSWVRSNGDGGGDGQGAVQPSELVEQISRILRLAPPTLFTRPSVYAAIINGLTDRNPRSAEGKRDIVDATQAIWEAALDRDIQPDLALLHAYCRALLRQGRVQDALQTMSTWLASRDYLSISRKEQDPSAFSRLVPDATFFHMALDGVSTSAGPSAAWSLYRSMTEAFKVRSDARSLASLMKSAEIAGGSLVDALMLRQGRPAAEPMMREAEREADWSGAPAPLRAWDVARNEMLRSHPDLERVRSPLEKRAGGGWLLQGEVGMRHVEDWIKDRFHWLVGHEGEKSPLPPRWVQGDGNPPIIFDAAFFHRYISLLRFLRSDDGRQALDRMARIGMGSDAVDATMSLAQPAWDEPYKALAWMRELSIVPQQTTLRLVCVDLLEMLPPGAGFFSASSVGRNKGRSSAAGPLHAWLVDWLGEEGVPTEESVGRQLRRSNLVRDQRRLKRLEAIVRSEAR